MWIARNKNGILGFYFNKPIKGINEWYPMFEDENYVAVDSNMFSEVKWSDEEPRELGLKPIKEEHGFVNLYKDGGQVKVGWKIFPTKKEAEENFKDDEKYITTANIQWRDSHDNL